MAYSNKFGSNFPTEVMALSNYEDLSAAMYPVAKQYLEYCISGQLESAAILRGQNPALDKCLIDAKVWNRISEEIHNTQIYALNTGQIVVVNDNEPSYPSNNLVWIGGEV